MAINTQARQTRSDPYAQQVLIRGLTFMRTGYPDRAVSVYSEGLKKSPTSGVLLSAMADAQFALGEGNLASFYVRKAIQQSPAQSDYHRQAFQFALDEGNTEWALELSWRLLELKPDDRTTFLNLINLLLRLQRNRDAADLAAERVARFSDSEEVLRASLSAFRATADLEMAQRTARQIVLITLDPDDRFLLASLYIQSRNIHLAADELLRVLQEDPHHEEALTAIYSIEKDLPNRNILAEIPEDVAPQLLVTDEISPADSLIIYLERLDADPFDDKSATRAGILMMGAGKLNEAIALSKKQIEADPRQLDMWILSIRASLAVGLSADAVRTGEDALVLFPGYAPLLYEFALSLAAENKIDQALLAASQAADRVSAQDPLTDKLKLLLDELNQHR